MKDETANQLLDAIEKKLDQFPDRRQVIRGAVVSITAMALLKEEGSLHALAKAQLAMLIQTFGIREEVMAFVKANEEPEQT